MTYLIPNIFRGLMAGLILWATAMFIPIAQAQTATSSNGLYDGYTEGGMYTSPTTTPGIPSTGIGPMGSDLDLLTGITIVGSILLIALGVAFVFGRKRSLPNQR